MLYSHSRESGAWCPLGPEFLCSTGAPHSFVALFDWASSTSLHQRAVPIEHLVEGADALGEFLTIGSVWTDISLSPDQKAVLFENLVGGPNATGKLFTIESVCLSRHISKLKQLLPAAFLPLLGEAIY